MAQAPAPASSLLRKHQIGEDPNPASSKKAKGDPAPAPGPAIYCDRFMGQVAKAMEEMCACGAMNGDEMHDYVVALVPRNGVLKVPLEKCECWCAETLVEQSEKITAASGNRFKFFKKPPETMTSDDFCKNANTLSQRYTAFIKNRLSECADANRSKQNLIAGSNSEFLLPLRVVEKDFTKDASQNSSTALQIFQTLEQFFNARPALLKNLEVADALEKVLHHVWNHEKEHLTSYSEGQSVLEIGTRLCSQIYREGSFKIPAGEWNNKFFQAMKLALRRAVGIDFSRQMFQVLQGVSSFTFPLRVVDREFNSSTLFASPLLDWVNRHHLLEPLSKQPNLAPLLEILYKRAGETLEGEPLYRELHACITLGLPEREVHRYQLLDGKHLIPDIQAQVMAKVTSRMHKGTTFKSMSRQAFDLLYNGVIHNIRDERIPQLAHLSTLAAYFKITSLAKCSFEAVLHHGENYNFRLSTLIAIDKAWIAPDALTPEQALRWQQARDRWIAGWLSENPANAPLSEWFAHQEALPEWCQVKKLVLKGNVSAQVMMAVARLPLLTELQVDVLELIPDLEEGDYPALAKLTAKAKQSEPVLQQLFQLPHLTLLNLECEEISFLPNTVKGMTESQQLKLILSKSCDLAHLEQYLTQLPRLTSLDLVSRFAVGLPELFKKITLKEIALRLVEKPSEADVAACKELPPVHLLELQGGWGTCEILQGLSPTILCLGDTFREQVRKAPAAAAETFHRLDKVKVVQMKLPREMIRLPELFTRPLDDLHIQFRNTQPGDVTPQWKRALIPTPRVVEVGSVQPHQPSGSYDEVESAPCLQSQRFTLTGIWHLGGFLCSKLVVETKAEVLTLWLKPLQEVDLKLEQELVTDVLGPAFPKVKQIVLSWENEDQRPSFWFSGDIGRNRSFSLII